MALRLLPDDLLHRTHTQTDSKRTLALWTHLRGTARRTYTMASTHSLHARTPSAQNNTATCTPCPRPHEFFCFVVLFFPSFMQLPPCQSTMIKMIARNRSTGHALTATWVGPFISLVAITHPEPLKQLLKGAEGRRYSVWRLSLHCFTGSCTYPRIGCSPHPMRAKAPQLSKLYVHRVMAPSKRLRCRIV